MIEDIEGLGRPLLRAFFWTGSVVHRIYRVIAFVPAAFGSASRARANPVRYPLSESPRI